METQSNKDHSTSTKIPGQRINPKPLTKTFAPIPNWLLSRREVSFGAKAMYARLTQFANDEGIAWPSQQRLAEELGIKTRQAKTYIQELVRLSLIATRLQGMPASNEYYFLYHPWMDQNYSQDGQSSALQDGQSSALQDGQSSALQDGQSSALQDGQSSALQDGQSSAPNKNIEKIKEKNTHTTEKESVCVSKTEVSKYSAEDWYKYALAQKNITQPKALAMKLAKSQDNDWMMQGFLDNLHQQQQQLAAQQQAQQQKALKLEQERLYLISTILSAPEPLSESDMSLLRTLGYSFTQHNAQIGAVTL